MTTTNAQQRAWQITAGTQPSTDSTALSTTHYTHATRIRYVDGLPQKLGGWNASAFDGGAAVSGKARAMTSAFLTGQGRTLIGTHTKLYGQLGQRLEDITPAGLAEGFQDEFIGYGYGAGMYGAGLYGTNKTSTGPTVKPRIWFFDRFGVVLIGTAGNQTGLYEWDGDFTHLPTLITNAPTAINYAFVSNNIIVTFGQGGVENRIKTSDLGNKTVWTSAAENQVFEDELEGQGRLLSHIEVAGSNLIFTETSTVRMEYTGQPLIWKFTVIEPAIGIIGPMARCASQGTAYWMGRDNFYMWRGGNVEIIPSNTTKQATIHDYVFSDLNFGQKSKCFSWFNEKFSEIWFHYPKEGSTDPDRVARVNVRDWTWSYDDLDRLCAEYPSAQQEFPRLIAGDGTVYKHESGNDEDGAAMAWSLATPKIGTGAKVGILTGVIPDSVQTGDIALQVDSWLYPQSAAKMFSQSFTVSPTTEVVSLNASGRVFQYTLSGAAVGQDFVMGQWIDELQEAGRR